MNIPRLVLLFFLPLLCVTSVWAVDPNRHITQYAHTAWRVQDGIEVGTTVTQTLDGYLWFGTSNGLMRFDGVRFIPYDLPPLTPPLRSFNYLLGAGDGSRWIGTRDGLARLKDGKLQWFSDPAQHSGISVILEDPEGTIWLTRYPYRGARVLYVECREMNFTVTAKPTEYRLSMALDWPGTVKEICGLGPAHWLKATLCRWCRQSRRQLLVDTLALAEDRQECCEFKCAIPRLAMYGCR